MGTGHLPALQCWGSPSFPALRAWGSHIRANVERGPVVPGLHPCILSLPAQSVKDPTRSPAQDPNQIARSSAPIHL